MFLLEKAGEFANGLKYDNSSKHRLFDINQLQELIMKDAGKTHTILITSIKRYMEYKQRLPNSIIEPKHVIDNQSEIQCIERLGGLLKSYQRLAA